MTEDMQAEGTLQRTNQALMAPSAGNEALVRIRTERGQGLPVGLNTQFDLVVQSLNVQQAVDN